MQKQVGDYIDNIIDVYEINKACELIENYTLKVVKNFIDKKDSQENLAHFLGNLAFLYSKKDIPVRRIKNFINKLSFVFPYANIKLINHISNFMEIVLTYHGELVNFYLNKLYGLKELMEADYCSILYKACALPCYKNYISRKEVENKIFFDWRYNYQMCCFNFSYDKYFEALNYINRAIDKCPENLKKSYEELKKEIYMAMRS